MEGLCRMTSPPMLQGALSHSASHLTRGGGGGGIYQNQPPQFPPAGSECQQEGGQHSAAAIEKIRGLVPVYSIKNGNASENEIKIKNG